MRSPKTSTCALAICLSASVLLTTLPAIAVDTRIRGEFEYSLDEQTLDEWELGLVFALNEATEVEVPIGQDNGKWETQIELVYEVEANEVEFEFSVGLEATEDEAFQSFGGIEASIEF